MFCKNCGAEIAEGKKFCPNCGQPVSGESIGQTKPQVSEKVNDVQNATSQSTFRATSVQSKKGKGLAIPVIAVVILIIAALVFCVLKFLPKSKPATAPNAAPYDEGQEMIANEPEVIYEGWVGDYYYNNGEKVKNAMVGEYYVGDDGRYVINRWIGNSYYGQDGLKVRNQWIDGYYLDANGNYVVNKWVGNYYVGQDGKKLVNTTTPDGYYVGADGVYVPKQPPTTQAPAPTQTQTYIPISPEETTTAVDHAGEELYISATKKITDELYDDDDNKCSVAYTKPIISGIDEDEVAIINDLISEDMMNEISTSLEELVHGYGTYPKSVTVTKAEMTTLTSKRMRITLTGKLTPRSGASKSLKYRISYDRESCDMELENLSK